MVIVSYAPLVTAFASLGALTLACITLWYLRRDHQSKYTPYIWGGVQIEPFADKPGFFVAILPKNMGSHPCKARVLEVGLTIGDEVHRTPDHKGWILLAPSGMAVQLPAGHVNEVGLTGVKEARYRSNRIEISFKVDALSFDKRFRRTQAFTYEIDVRGEKPVELLRMDLIEDA